MGDEDRDDAGRLHLDDTVSGIKDTIRFTWEALDGWFEEDEEVFVHPRSPYSRVDALRSTRTAQVQIDGTVIAESRSPVLVFETGLPTRYYLNRTDVDVTLLRPNATESQCPYKGRQSGGWDAVVDGSVALSRAVRPMTSGAVVVCTATPTSGRLAPCGN